MIPINPIPQHDNLLISSIYLWLDNYILTKGQGYTNTNVSFYRISETFNGIQSYASPFNQFISDSSITGAYIGTGVYINNVLCGTGENGLYHIDYNNGRIYTTGLNNNATISGQFGVKYFNLKLTNEPDEKILTDTSYTLRPKTNITLTGLNNNQNNYPIIFIKDNGSFNMPLTFGGLENTINNIRLIALADSLYSINALNSILRDTCKRNIPLLSIDDMPFNLMGDFKNSNYNYTGLTQPIINQGNLAYINEVYVAKYNQSYVDLRNINSKIYWSIIDMEIHTHRYPRS